MPQKSALAILAVLVTLMLGSFQAMHKAYPWPYPPMSHLIAERTGLQDAALITAGFRPLAADIAWIQLLQYVGGWILPGEQEVSRYLLLKDMTLRVTRIDPYFRQVYLYSAGMLAFFRNIDRPDEALEVLGEGIRTNPQFWPLRVTVAAIGFMRGEEFEPMVRLLEDVIAHPDCPPVTKSILANAYKAHHRDADARRIWELILGDPNAGMYHDKARREIVEIDTRQLLTPKI